MTTFWNRHKEFRKNRNNGKPSQCVIICDLVLRKNKKLGIRKISWKRVLRNELQWTKIQDFQAKWRMLWWHSWHSLFKYFHIIYKRASWNGEQCCRRKFSFSLHKKIISHFPSAENGLFCEATTKNMLLIWTTKIYKNIGPYLVHK